MERTPSPAQGGRKPAFSSHILQLRQASDLRGVPLDALKGEILRRGISRPPRRANAVRLAFACLSVLLSAAFFLAAATTAIPGGDSGRASVGAAASAPVEEAEQAVLPSPSQVPEAVNVTASSELSVLFDSFDTNRDGLDLAEARSFYDWVEQNIEYRYDNEDAESPLPGFEVGDGRPGRDYQQTPGETFAERLGDCEDQAALEMAFYRHHGVPVYMAYVNARSNETYDHAVAIVWASDSLEGLRKLLGSVPYYHIQGRPGVQDGYYFIVDNTYSSTFAAVSGGIGDAKFLIHGVRHFEELFADSKLAPVLS